MLSEANARAIGGVDGVFDAVVSAMRRHKTVGRLERSACDMLRHLVVCGPGERAVCVPGASCTGAVRSVALILVS